MIPMSNTLINFQTAISELKSAIEDVLQSEQDLTHLCLTNKDRTTRLEVEMLLENFSKKTEELHNEIQEILSNIQTTKKAIEMTMSNTRNNLMRLNLHISLVSLTLSSAAVTSGIFGMNLLSGFEEHPYMFYYVITFMPIFGITIYSIIAWNYLGRNRQFAHITKFALSSNFFNQIYSLNCIDQLGNETTRENFHASLKQATGIEITKSESDQIFNIFQATKQDKVHPEELEELKVVGKNREFVLNSENDS